LPRCGDALEVVVAAVFEGDSGSRDEIDDDTGDEHLAGLCGVADAACEVDRDAGEFGAALFDLTGMNPDPTWLGVSRAAVAASVNDATRLASVVST
jgi:hypothetical protein